MSVKIKFESGLSKEEKYIDIVPRIISLIEDEKDFIANVSNITSALKFSFNDFLWVGFYFKDGDELVLGPFQGKPACTRFVVGKGVCGTAALRKETIIVEDVNMFPGHIFCDSDSKSEIVIPVLKDGELKAVLDIDSGEYGSFDNTDKKHLEDLIFRISKIF
ncbi:MAG TPA: GAF domain-containing protein [Ignavibacteria bacterium]